MTSDPTHNDAPSGSAASNSAPLIDISARGVGKKFGIYMNDRDRVFELFTRKNYHEEFWALRDLSFEIPRGTAYGVIGSNGAGKSTLLKLLAGVSRPTEGELTVNATISSLLDLGLGFHQNFSGRQNIYLNCTLQGLARAEIDALLPDIVSFAELESFIDYPVKTYSSGMSLRLGFAIASHLNYDIFLIDEVLTVGDQYFQRKCVRKIEEFIAQGRTIVLVSHDLHSVRSLCDRVLWLKEGRAVAEGPAADVVDAYMDAVRSREGGVRRTRPLPVTPLRRPPSEEAAPRRLSAPGTAGAPAVTSTEGAASGAGSVEDPTAEQDGFVELLLQVLEPGKGGGDGAPRGAGERSDLDGSSRPGEGGDGGTVPAGEGTGDDTKREGEVDADEAGRKSGDGGPLEIEVAPLRAEAAARYHQHAPRPPQRGPAQLSYRTSASDPGLRQRVVSAATLSNALEIWEHREEVAPFMEYHGDLPLVTGSGEARVLEILILGPDGQPRDSFSTGDMVTVAVTVKAVEPVEDPIFGVAIHRNDDVYVYGPNTAFDRVLKGTYHGVYTFFLHYPSLPLLAGTYLLSIALWDKHHLKPYVWHNRLYTISFKADREDHGLVVIPHDWGVITHHAGPGEVLPDPATPDPDGSSGGEDR